MKSKQSQQRELFWSNLTIVRFSIVALFGEAFYFLLYWIVLSLTQSTSKTLAIAGGICVILNAYIHSRVTFRVAFNRKLLFGYILIQLLGYLVAMICGIAMDYVHANKWLIALATYLIWATMSYVLSKKLYTSEKTNTLLTPTHPKPQTFH